MEPVTWVEVVEQPRLLGLEGCATYLDITQRSIYRLIERGIITPVRLPGMRRILFDRRDLDALIDRGKLRTEGVDEESIKQSEVMG